ncbi:pyridoxine kinase [Aspergillus nomiae NRRL 13137]|uniref:pyridoxal kinase n=1 Tax=Aspergillus nomiae NRRL (strain ATCC 15546 / NRRL 13137 / CBS 260.88 / M93) TaxID=1509407 RepID=A0A0L1IXH3_ASPN3|nr:pyridoxine kinase [Aspergillus nomiae NRRL 13137]KNG83873.1 pyridoxine kinase [Aspergillus nomiae NRRL 13137]
MSTVSLVPETRVLAIASHVSHFVKCGHDPHISYVGNKMATLVMQLLGCDVAALNTVHFSNHTGYRQFKGTRATAEQITELYEGLCQSHLTDFDVMLSGYAPSAAAVEAVGAIGMDLQRKAEKNPGSFFWVLDPVMGDQGRLYVSNDVVPAYKTIIHHADLILPNQFEAETLSGIKITSLSTLAEAITAIHATYNVPHIIITSVDLSRFTQSPSSQTTTPPDSLTVIGSTTRSDGPRVSSASTSQPWTATSAAQVTSPDDKVLGVPRRGQGHGSPSARATVQVLASMHSVLEKTMEARDAELRAADTRGDETLSEEERLKREHLRKSKAAEVRLVRNVQYLREPTVVFQAQEWRKEDLPAGSQ